MNYFDAHAHMRATVESRDALLCSMAMNGIRKTVVVGGGLLKPEVLSRQLFEGGSQNVSFDNLRLEALTSQSNERLFPFYFANPFDEVEEYKEHGKRFYGLKFAPGVHGVPFHDESIQAYVRLAECFSHPVYLHCLAKSGFAVTDLVTLANCFPSVPFILGHAGIGTLDLYGVEVISSQKNIYFETSGGLTAVIKYARKLLGAERLIFGTEYPLQNPRVEIVKAETLDLDAEDFDLYSSRNIGRLIGVC